MRKWIFANPWIAAGIVVLFFIALGSAIGFFQTRRALKQTQSILVENTKAKEKELEDAKKASDAKWELETERKLAPVLKERDALRVRLARIQADAAKPFVTPTSDAEIENRWQLLGYRVRVLK